MKTRICVLAFLCLLFTNCTMNTLDDVMEPIESTGDEGSDNGDNGGDQGNDGGDGGDTGDLVTYVEVRPIIQNSCVRCHSNPPQNSAPMSLETYNDVRLAVLNRDLIDLISRPPGDNDLMPPGGPRLPQESINTIIQWRDDGFPEN